MTPRVEVLFIGGRAGVGKTSVAAELHALLAADRIQHCLIEGDNLGLAWPTPWERSLQLAELNLASMWSVYQAAGYSRLIYTNTTAVRSAVLDSLLTALGGDPVVHGVLLTATDATAAARLERREVGSMLGEHLDRSRRAALALEESAPNWVSRISTDYHSVAETALRIKRHLRWTPLTGDRHDRPGRSGSHDADDPLTVRILTSVTPDVVKILRPAIGAGSSPELWERTRRVAEAATTLTGHHGDRLVAAACVESDGTHGRLAAIAVAPGDRGRGWARSLIAAIPSLLGVGELNAETDTEAVGFYSALGFTVTSLGERYPGVERFACSLTW